MPKVISANRLTDGIVVYAGRDGTWTGRLGEANLFTSQAEAEAGLRMAQSDAKRNLVVEPCIVEVVEEASGLRAVTLRESIRAQGPTIGYLPSASTPAVKTDPPLGKVAKQDTKAVLRTSRVEDARVPVLTGAAGLLGETVR